MTFCRFAKGVKDIFTLREICKKLKQPPTFIKLNDPILYYQGFNVVTEQAQPQNDILYICQASQLREDFLLNKNIGLIIIPDSDLEQKMDFQCEWILWPEEVPLLELIHSVQSVFLNINEHRQDTSVLFETLVNGNGIDELIKSACRILGNPILLVDSAYRVISSASIGEINDLVWVDALKYGYCSNELISKFKSEELLLKLNSSKKPIIVDDFSSSKVPRILGKSMVDGKDVAYIGVMAYNKPIESFHIEIVDVLCTLIALELKNDPEKNLRATTIYKNLIMDILGERIHSPYYLHHRLVLANWKTKAHFIVLHIPILKDDINIYYLDYLQESLENSTIYAKTVVFKDSIVVLLNFDSPKESASGIEHLSRVLQSNRIKAGMSRSFDQLFDLNRYYQQAIAAFYVGESLHQTEHIHTYNKLAPYHLIAEVARHHNLDDFSDPGYEQLYQYDQENHTDYLQTLYQYALCACSVSRTAARLHLHRNSISYRLEKISEITGYDLANGDDIYKFLMSCRIAQWLTPTSPSWS